MSTESETPEKQVYNVYLDESRIDNPESNYMVIGGTFVSRDKVRQIQKHIKAIRQKHEFFGEIKWTRVDARKKDFLEELIKHVLQLPENDFSFNCIVVQKDAVNYEKYHDGDKELAFFKFIYELLKQRLKNNSTYYIFLDFKPTKIKERVKNLGEFLTKHIYFNNNNTDIKHFQAYDSSENIFIQLADLFSGAVAYHYNGDPEGTEKDKMASFIANNLGRERLFFATPRSEKKFNIFKIILS